MSSITERVSTGITGLDEILDGGLIAQRSCLVRGGPGRGKTTIGLQFLAAAADKEDSLFIGFQESDAQLRANADAVGIDITGVRFLSLAPDEQFFSQQLGYDVFSAADVEQEPVVKAVLEAVEKKRPKRVFVDSLTQLRFLSADVYQYRKQVLSFLRYLTGCGATVMFSSEHSREMPDDDLQFMSDGVINLDANETGASVRVSKFRGSDFIRGPHQMRVRKGGVVVYARTLPPARKQVRDERWQWTCGIPAIDTMLNGGIEAGTISLLTGPSGVGKSTLASLFVAEAARNDRRAVVYLFEEEIQTFHRRCKSLGIALEEAFQDNRVSLEQVEPMRYLADEFALKVRRQVEEEGIELVVIDSTAGFELTLEGEDIRKRLHTMAKTLSRLGVTVVLVNEVESLMGEFKVSEKGISYLADNVIFMRYLETGGELRKAMGVLKKRLSNFDPRLHLYRIGGKTPMTVDAGIDGLGGVMSSGPVLQEE